MSAPHASTRFAVVDPRALLGAWVSFREVLGVTAVRSRSDYDRARATIDMLLDEVGEQEDHPLAEVLDYLGVQVRAWEDTHVRIPKAEPCELLRFLMDQHGLRQEDLADCAPQSRISEILNGRRAISKRIAKALAERFHVSAALFL